MAYFKVTYCSGINLDRLGLSSMQKDKEFYPVTYGINISKENICVFLL